MFVLRLQNHIFYHSKVIRPNSYITHKMCTFQFKGMAIVGMFCICTLFTTCNNETFWCRMWTTIPVCFISGISSFSGEPVDQCIRSQTRVYPSQNNILDERDYGIIFNGLQVIPSTILFISMCLHTGKYTYKYTKFKCIKNGELRSGIKIW